MKTSGKDCYDMRMQETLITAGAWAAGMIVQALLVLRGDITQKDRFRWVCIGLFMLAGFIPGKNEVEYSLNYHIFVSFIGIVLGFQIFFHQKILPHIDEYVFATWNVLLGYVLVRRFGIESPWILLPLIPITASLLFLLTPLQPGTFVKSVLYAWYLLAVATIGILFFDLANFEMFFQDAEPLRLPWPDAFMSGMAFLSIGYTLCFLILLLPIPGKGQSLRDRMKECRELVDLMVSRYSNDQAHPGILAIYLAALIAVGILNHVYAVISDALFISVLLVGSPYLLLGLSWLRAMFSVKNPSRSRGKRERN